MCLCSAGWCYFVCAVCKSVCMSHIYGCTLVFGHVCIYVSKCVSAGGLQQVLSQFLFTLGKRDRVSLLNPELYYTASLGSSLSQQSSAFADVIEESPHSLCIYIAAWDLNYSLYIADYIANALPAESFPQSQYYIFQNT